MIRIVVRKLFINPRFLKLYTIGARLLILIGIVWILTLPLLSEKLDSVEKSIKPKGIDTKFDKNPETFQTYNDLKLEVKEIFKAILGL